MTGWAPQRAARAVLTAVCPAADPRLTRLLAGGDACAALQALRRLGDKSAWSRRANQVDAAALSRQADVLGLRFLIPSDAGWPAALTDLDGGGEVGGMAGGPLGLWVAGELDLAEQAARAVAIVGARAATRYGEAVATNLAAELADPQSNRYTVVSGGAYGIDAAAHRGALAARGVTIGVYAGGLDEPYPRGNSRLFDRLVRDGLVLSEVAPGVRQNRAGFLARNRLIAALGAGTVVVEAAARSGARNTASWAAELGRVVMAVPGSVHSAMSVGCHRLVRDGLATLVTDTEDVLGLLAPIGSRCEPSGRGPERPLDGLDPVLLEVREAMPGRGATSAALLSTCCELPLREVVAALSELEVLGLVRRDDDGGWRIRRPARE